MTTFSGSDQAAHPVEMLLIDHFYIAVVGQSVFAVHNGDPLAHRFQKPLFHAAFNQQIVRCHAGLPAVEQLAEYQALGRQIQFGGVVPQCRDFFRPAPG